MAISLSIVGRPNVGKSTLFNRLVGKRTAIVNNSPGVTRDFQEGRSVAHGMSFKVIDTAGWDTRPESELDENIFRMTRKALENSTALLFTVDARTGILPVDLEISQRLRKQSLPVILVANKSESRIHDCFEADVRRLGWGEPVYISAEHGTGMSNLIEHIEQCMHSFPSEEELAVLPEAIQENDWDGVVLDNTRPLRIAVIGRPNAGKSSMINQIVGDERLLTGATPGITRDAISIRTAWEGFEVEIYDTAGMRRKSRVVDDIEKESVSEGLRAIRFSEIVIVLIDATSPLDTQDLRIADMAEREGRGVVIAINKWDLVKDKKARQRELHHKIETSLPQLKGIKLICVSALYKRGLKSLLREVKSIHEIWNYRVSTGELNKWLEHMVYKHPPPAVAGLRIKLRFISQINNRPPTFVLKCSKPKALPTSYKRYLINGLRNRFNLRGIPIRLLLRNH
ncbi:MAG: ribosome biogenesis GTPase Der [Rhodobacteraceae bacterium]|nr:ribosome biogenesis GTPase Der [Paracoccaceae bacterium]